MIGGAVRTGDRAVPGSAGEQRFEPGSLADAAIAEELMRLRAEIDRAEARFARLAWAAHRRGVCTRNGSPSTAAWLRRRTGMSEGDARAAIDAGEVCSEVVPATGDAWASGTITAGAARTIVGARVEGHDAELRAVEPVLLELARHGDVRELRRACAHFRSCARADGSEPRQHDGLTLSRTYDGRTFVQAELSELAAETVVTAIHAFTDPPTDGDARNGARRRADALVRMAEVALASLPEHADRVRTRATIVVDWATLTGRTTGEGEFTGPIHPAEIDRALCDSTVARVVTGADRMLLDAGRARRTIPPPLRRALVARDRGCRFPGCDRPPGWCDAHHVVHWRSGGRTDRDNLVLLCDHHHHVVHRPGWVVKLDGADLRVLRPDGVEIA